MTDVLVIGAGPAGVLAQCCGSRRANALVTSGAFGGIREADSVAVKAQHTTLASAGKHTRRHKQVGEC
jgi:thioredoxin reductase